jgi:hypothetical protein
LVSFISNKPMSWISSPFRARSLLMAEMGANAHNVGFDAGHDHLRDAH